MNYVGIQPLIAQYRKCLLFMNGACTQLHRVLYNKDG